MTIDEVITALATIKNNKGGSVEVTAAWSVHEFIITDIELADDNTVVLELEGNE